MLDPWQLAGLLYLGSGLGLTVYRIARAHPAVRPKRQELGWLAGAILAGGVVAPVLLLFGLTRMPASGAALLLNMEGVFTALLAAWVFKEHIDRRVAAGMGAIVIGAGVLSWSGDVSFTGLWPALAILAACLSWALDNNLTRKIAHVDATWLAATKGWFAGSVNLALASYLEVPWPSFGNAGLAMLTGFFTYGVSLVLFVLALRDLGVARTSGYFSIAPFFGAVLALASGEPVHFQLVVAAILMGIGLWLHVTETHDHFHTHEPDEHEHEHSHDEHHRHDHGDGEDVSATHTHSHRHEALPHAHPHFPDIHHRHGHQK